MKRPWKRGRLATRISKPARFAALLLLLLAAAVLAGCTRSAAGAQPWRAASGEDDVPVFPGDSTPRPAQVIGQTPSGPNISPTPDVAKVLPTPRLEEETYVVQPSDSLGVIAQRYGVPLDSLIDANELVNPNLLEVGQVLTIPASEPLPTGPDVKIVPDSELVYGPSTAAFDVRKYINDQNGYLNHYSEELDGRTWYGPEIVLRVAQEYSVNPRLLLAVLEYRSGWVTNPGPSEESLQYPILYFDARRQGLYRQLAWAANNLNRGYYLWRVNGIGSWILQDGSVVPIAPTLNAGTVGVQHFFSLLLGNPDWEQAVTEDGLLSLYTRMFGYPFSYAFEPMIPENLTQPAMQLPFEPGEVWSFTGGPHGGWADGSAWAAIDFAPPGPALGCVTNDAWVVAVADGEIIRTGTGAVVQDLDGDGLEQTGWTVLYMHVESRDRVQPGTFVRAGDRIGHASCEGGISTGTHLHLARRYNGEWIPADADLPFNLDGWVSEGDGSGYEYNGYLVNNGSVVEAWEGRRDENQISR